MAQVVVGTERQGARGVPGGAVVVDERGVTEVVTAWVDVVVIVRVAVVEVVAAAGRAAKAVARPQLGVVVEAVGRGGRSAAMSWWS